MKSPFRPLTRLAGHAALALAAVALPATLLAPRPALADEAPAKAAADDDLQATAADFIRFKSDPNGGGALQTSIVRYADDGGDTVDLIGAIHIADHAYYELLNERFKKYDSLLYEMVKPKDVDMARRAEGEGGGGINVIHMLQKAMQTVLELSYQLDDVNYQAENFVHADMDLETFTRRQDETGQGFLEMMIKQMLNGLSNPQKADADAAQPPTFLEIMDAMNAPDRARRLKLLFAEQLSHADEMMEQLPADQPSVIVDERNAAAFEVLDKRLAGGEKHLALFYGAAHLKKMAGMLEDRGFHKVGDPEWLTAWDMTLDGHGREEMRERLRQAIVADAVQDGKVEPAAGGGGGGGTSPTPATSTPSAARCVPSAASPTRSARRTRLCASRCRPCATKTPPSASGRGRRIDFEPVGRASARRSGAQSGPASC